MGSLRSFLVDLGPLRESRDYRLIWIAQAVAIVGRQAVLVAIPYQVYVLTGSSFAVGLIGLTTMVPTVIAGLYGGALADRFDRRLTMLWFRAATAVTSVGLAAVTFSPVPGRLVWLYVLAGVAGFTATVDMAARSATVPRLFSRERLPAALSLSQVQLQLGLTAGPAVAGAVIAAVGPGFTYVLDVAAGMASMALIWPLASQPGSRAVEVGWRAPLEGLREVRRNRVVAASFLADLAAMIFGLPRAVFPALALGTFGLGPFGLGLLYAAPGAGALAGTFFTGWVAGVHRQGRAVVISVAAWGIAIVAFALVGRHLWLGFGLLAVAGAADMVSAVFRGAILQLTVPDHLRGRMSAFGSMVVTTGPRLGDFESGVAAALSTPQFSVLSGGVLCLVGLGLVAWRHPELWRYDASRPGPNSGEVAALPPPKVDRVRSTVSASDGRE